MIIQRQPPKENAIVGSNVEAGYAKLQGVDFEYYMQTYSIVLGRNSKKSIVDLDLSSLGGGMKISRHHARIFFDFTCHRFALEVLGKNGCLVKGVVHLPRNPLVKLDSQDLIQIGNIKFYFLLPIRSILGGSIGPHHYLNHVVASVPMIEGLVVPHYNYSLATVAIMIARGDTSVKNKRKRVYYDDQYNGDGGGGGGGGGGSSGKKGKRDGYGGYEYGGVGSKGKALLTGASNKKKSKGRSRVDRDADNLQLQQLQKKNVVLSVANVLSDLCGPEQWIPIEKLHAELVKKYSSVWHKSRVRRYLTSEDWAGPKSKGKPWYGLLMLLRMYPEHFVINTRPKEHWIHHPMFKSLIPLLMPGVLLPNDEVAISVCLK